MGQRFTLGPTSSNPTTNDPNIDTLAVTFAQQPKGFFIYRASLFGPPETIARLYVGYGLVRSNFRAISYFGKTDDADFPRGLYVPPAVPVSIAWYDVSAPADINHPVTILSGSVVAQIEVEFEEIGGHRGALSFAGEG